MTRSLAPFRSSTGPGPGDGPLQAIDPTGASAVLQARAEPLRPAVSGVGAEERPSHPWVAPGRLTRRPAGSRGLARGAWTHGAWAYPLLFTGSVLESTLLPWPIEFPLLAVMLRGRGHVFPAAVAVIAGSVAGCVLAFLAGVYAFELLAPSFAGFAPAETLAAARDRVDAGGAWAVFFGMMTPVPVQLTSLAAGIGGVGFFAFLAAAAAGRTVRYLSMAVLVFAFGGSILRWWRRRSFGMKTAAIMAFLMAFVAALWLSLSP